MFVYNKIDICLCITYVCVCVKYMDMCLYEITWVYVCITLHGHKLNNNKYLIFCENMVFLLNIHT